VSINAASEATGSIIGDVAIKLLGEPGQKLKQNKEWRYGRRGSLAVDLAKGNWHDFEEGGADQRGIGYRYSNRADGTRAAG
jgi:hypothetical protein